MDQKQDERFRALISRQQTELTLRKFAVEPHSAPGCTYLVSDFRQRDDLPVTASLRKMSSTVAKKLAEIGLREPISLRSVPDYWWKVKIDAAEIGLVCEYGNAFVIQILSTNELMSKGFEVVDGPFSALDNNGVS